MNIASATLRAAFVLAAIGIPPAASASPPPPPPIITPPAGNVPFLTIRGQDTQDYICEQATPGDAPAFVFIGPQSIFAKKVGAKVIQLVENVQSAVPGRAAEILPGCLADADGQQLCPTFQSVIDRSVVWGTKMASIAGGSDPSCPRAGGVACLLVKTVATGPDSGYAGLLSTTTFIQRLDTEGGLAPTRACTPGELAFVPYAATYRFFQQQQNGSGR